MSMQSFVPTCLLCLALLTTPTLAQYTAGTGEPNDPYQIADPNDWQTLTNNPTHWDKHFILINDIDFAGATLIPVAPDTSTEDYDFQGTPFTGHFNGNGHVLRNASIAAEQYVGLFGYLGANAEIVHLCTKNLDVSGGKHVGGLVGQNTHGTVKWCCIAGTLEGRYSFPGGGVGAYAGGLVGSNSGTIISCYATGPVTGDLYVGGLVGSNTGTITSSYTTTKVNGWYSDVGGLVGSNGSGGTVTSSYATGDVMSVGGEGTNVAGGLVGSNASGGTLTSCYATGVVEGDFWWTGGLAGLNAGAITSCYATGPVTCESGVGGLVGENRTEGTITYSYATGAVSGDYYVGGLVGSNSQGGTITACFWDVETTGQTGSGGGKGLTTEQMKTIFFFQNAGWADKGWGMQDGLDYARLQWENTPGVSMPPPGPVPLLGNGTETDPYQICTVEDFAFLSWHVAILDKHIALMTDLDLTDVTLYPIGDLGPFSGVFNGQAFLLNNAVIHQPYSSHVGLFSIFASGGEIRNLGVENVNMCGSYYVGGLAGQSCGTITSSYVTGNIVGHTSYYYSFYVGGLVGYNGGTIISCHATANVNGGYSHVGGLVGHNTGTITSCYATGAVNSTYYSFHKGGLLGWNAGAVTSSYATGAVNGYSGVGGLVGQNLGTVTWCYATGVVTGYDDFGGLAGASNDTISSSFWDIDTTGLTTSAGGTGLHTTDMQTIAPFLAAGWDFTNETANGTADTWRMCTDHVDYPRLAFQFSPDLTCPDGVATEDLALLTTAWLTTPADPTWLEACDLNHDNLINLADFAPLATAWLTTPSPSTP